MNKVIPVVDIFSGAGGFQEGFSAYRNHNNQRRYRVVLSIEKESYSYHTLRLRNFLHMFEDDFPVEYYDFLNNKTPKEPDWKKLYPKEWRLACHETLHTELGVPKVQKSIKKRIACLRKYYNGRTILLGGPPCQTYSILSRSLFKEDDLDNRNFLYESYVDVLTELQPMIAIFENVKGILSRTLNGKYIVYDIMRKLCHAGGIDRYRLFTLTCDESLFSNEWQDPRDFVVHSENYGIPQMRDRIFIICVRDDVPIKPPKINQCDSVTTVKDILSMMPKLRSRLRDDDSLSNWQNVIRISSQKIIEQVSSNEEGRFRLALEDIRNNDLLFEDVPGGTTLPLSCPIELRDWIYDKNIEILPNNKTRKHSDEELTLYLFAIAYYNVYGRSAKIADFPYGLTKHNKNFYLTNFKDRYRIQQTNRPSFTIISHTGNSNRDFIYPDINQCRGITVREAARLQTFQDNYFFYGSMPKQYVQIGNAVPPFLSYQIANAISDVI